ncbi:Transglycosylase SLT domain-containing protein [Rhizobium sp. RU20A]|uniref:lytic transglycosylase domain-containing protein n=1 Tax=Rhizobium sp. RU20A TaxID=1907412 RepID=UPI0009571008|nr:lytic transglycosylase domain-containing protein [Rhizobium sp. RU20A]SIQ21321.1 Transglycosylase SLT domain-containing protein [Rhizobium sp. RU20A]
MKRTAATVVAACLGMLVAGTGPLYAAKGDNRSATSGGATPASDTKLNGDGKTLGKTKLSFGTRDAGFPLVNPALKTSYTPIIANYARQYGVPVELAHAVIKVESNFNPKARGRAGEIGLMQIKPATARMLGYSGSTRGLYDPETNIRFGMKYLAMAHELSGGVTCGTILRYNAGHGATRMNPTSKRYCGKVQAIID